MKASGAFVCLLPLLLLQAATTADAATTTTYDYGVIIDAGSSGTRIWVYRWSRNYGGKVLPQYERVHTAKNSPGLSEFAEQPETISRVVLELLDASAQHVPRSQQAKTSVYLFATAGMRFLSEVNASKVLSHLDAILKDPAKNPYYYEAHHNSRILSGEEEGVFAWMAVNYLTGDLQNTSKEGKTSGILELGGASTQIAFVPKGSILADKFPVVVGSRTFPTYAHSYLYFGQDYVDLWVKEHLLINATDGKSIDNPCLLVGDVQYLDESRSVEFVGSGDPHRCSHVLGHLVRKVNPRFCHPKPCAIGHVYQPTIHPDQRFYAMSVFPLIFRDLEVLDPQTQTFTPGQVFQKSHDYCRKNFTELTATTKQKRWRFLSKPCVIGLYTALLFTRGYGFANDTRQIIGNDVINGTQADWTLGALIYEQAGSSFCPNSGSSLRPGAIFISVPLLPLRLHSFFPFLQMTFSPTGSQPAVSILIYLVLGAIFKRVHLV